MSDKLSREVGKAYRASTQCRLDRLVVERSRWQRKRTIATNKLAEVQRKLDDLLAELVKEKEGK